MKQQREQTRSALAMIRELPEMVRARFVKMADSIGLSPIHWACWKNLPLVLEALVDAGADVNLVDKCDGSTPLHHCANSGSSECAEILLKEGAAPDVRNAHRWTPLESARFHLKPNPDLIRCLERAEKGARPGSVRLKRKKG